MTDCQTIIRRAYRRSNILPAGLNMSAAQASLGLEHLRGLYQNLIVGGMFGRPRDVFVDRSAYDAKEGERVFMSLGGTVNLPTVVRDDFHGGNRQPRDFAFITVVDPISGITTQNIYDRNTATWTDINNVDLRDPAPLSGRYEDAITALLAERMLGDSDMPIPVELTRAAARARMALANRYDDGRRTGVGEFS